MCVTKLSRELIARFVLFVVCCNWWLFLLCRRVKKSTCLKKISSLFHGNSHPTELAGYQLAQLAGYQLAKLAVQQHGQLAGQQLAQLAGQQLAQKALREAGSEAGRQGGREAGRGLVGLRWFGFYIGLVRVSWS